MQRRQRMQVLQRKQTMKNCKRTNINQIMPKHSEFAKNERCKERTECKHC